MADGTAAIQAGVYGRLSGDAALMALLPGGVRDAVTAGVLYPYLLIGDIAARGFAAQGGGIEAAFDLTAVSRADGAREAQLILEAARAALEGAVFAVAGYTMVSCAQVGCDTKRDKDGMTRLGVARFRLVLKEI
jgi:Protein of unknown function (DUF3168)